MDRFGWDKDHSARRFMGRRLVGILAMFYGLFEIVNFRPFYCLDTGARPGKKANRLGPSLGFEPHAVRAWAQVFAPKPALTLRVLVKRGPKTAFAMALLTKDYMRMPYGNRTGIH